MGDQGKWGRGLKDHLASNRVKAEKIMSIEVEI